jgi:hypothetical protein
MDAFGAGRERGPKADHSRSSKRFISDQAPACVMSDSSGSRLASQGSGGITDDGDCQGPGRGWSTT